MTLEDLEEKFYAINQGTPTMYVFDCESEWSDFCRRNENAEILFTLCSSMKLHVYLQDKYRAAKVLAFCAVKGGVLAVLIDSEG